MNAALSIWFTLGLHFPVWALALSFSFTMNLQVTALFFLLSRKIRGLDMAFFWYEGLKMLIASFNTALITYFLIRLLDGLIFDTNRTINLFLLILVAFFFFSTVYIFLCWLFGVRELYIITSMLLKAKEYQKKILVLYKGVE